MNHKDIIFPLCFPWLVLKEMSDGLLIFPVRLAIRHSFTSQASFTANQMLGESSFHIWFSWDSPSLCWFAERTGLPQTTSGKTKGETISLAAARLFLPDFVFLVVLRQAGRPAWFPAKEKTQRYSQGFCMRFSLPWLALCFLLLTKPDGPTA